MFLLQTYYMKLLHVFTIYFRLKHGNYWLHSLKTDIFIIVFCYFLGNNKIIKRKRDFLPYLCFAIFASAKAPQTPALSPKPG